MVLVVVLLLRAGVVQDLLLWTILVDLGDGTFILVYKGGSTLNHQVTLSNLTLVILSLYHLGDTQLYRLGLSQGDISIITW